jgi:serine protease Do
MSLSDALRRSVVEVQLKGAAGSGFAAGSDVVVTSAHVVRGDRVQLRLPDGQERSARVRVIDRERDIAILEVPGLGLPTVELRDPGSLRPGEVLYAMGHPLGVRHALSSGVLHGVGPLPDGYPVAAEIRRWVWVQADLRLAPGNSGGPLADAEGRVIGVNALIVGGLALAVPISEVETLVRQRAA